MFQTNLCYRPGDLTGSRIHKTVLFQDTVSGLRLTDSTQYGKLQMSYESPPAQAQDSSKARVQIHCNFSPVSVKIDVMLEDSSLKEPPSTSFLSMNFDDKVANKSVTFALVPWT